MNITRKPFRKEIAVFSISRTKWIPCLIIMLVSVGLLIGCSSGKSENTSSKIDAFRAKFPAGMTRQEVEEVLQGLEGVTFRGEEPRGEGTIRVTYNTPIELYGSGMFKFVFTEDMVLERVTYVIIE